MRVLCADALDALHDMAEDSVDALVTDPPAGIAFMGKNWDDPSAESWGAFDSPYARRATTRYGTNGTRDIGNREKFIASLTPIFAECLRVLKPGAHGVVWALPRTSHWTATALEDAGFEVRDCVVHLFGQGFPKSHNVSAAIDRKLLGTGPRGHAISTASKVRPDGTPLPPGELLPAYEAKSDAAKKWNGWGTALKPASEHWIVVRKPLAEKSVAANVLKYGTGALNIDACRIGTEGEALQGSTVRNDIRGGHFAAGHRAHPDLPAFEQAAGGRWPANVVLSHHPICARVGERIVKGDPREGGKRAGRVSQRRRRERRRRSEREALRRRNAGGVGVRPRLQRRRTRRAERRERVGAELFAERKRRR